MCGVQTPWGKRGGGGGTKVGGSMHEFISWFWSFLIGGIYMHGGCANPCAKLTDLGQLAN
jgi:hypothetical protein